ncbi:hypothetical protein [Psychrobacter faecalis]|nr:hypothetical protein [Psychrobacter faecalis]
MKNQPNDMVTLEWLLPLFDQQLSQIADGWQLGEKSADYEQMTQSYHQIGGALIMINLPILANLATKLSLLARTEVDSLDADASRIGHIAHRLLTGELVYYARTSNFHSALINKTSAELTQVLARYDIATDHLVDASLDSKEDSLASIATNDIVDIALPVSTAMVSLDQAQYQQLLLVWRQQAQALLAADTNDASILATLEKVVQYLWQTAKDDDLQRLWYLTEAWLHDLAHNETPRPKYYAALLSQFDALIEASTHQKALSAKVINELIANIYIEISSLAKQSDSTQVMLQSVAPQEVETRFLPRILSDIDTLIFNFDKPQILIKPLQQISHQLGSRGWTSFASQAASILADIERDLIAQTGVVEEQSQ